ncbi:MAG: efflux RND transporter periplasmic adaptor subunit [Verrucomicrobiales bacterium]|nr:efflux RND transporter periplasmic adaptor subunit [Verrucomicrobiales bacterium]
MLAAWVGSGCGSGHPDAGPGAGAGGPPPPVVTVAPVEQREWVEHEELTGRTAPVEFVEVRPRISGHLDEVRFESGQLVKKGEVLFRIDPRWQRATLEQREAELAMAQVRLETAEREARRNVQLLESRAISREDAESRESRAAEARAGLLAARAARDSARLDLDHTEIRSPIDGRVSRAMVTLGNYVSGLAGAATLLTTVVSVDPVHVYADLDEATLLKFNALVREGRLPKDAQGRIPVQLQLGDEVGFAREGFIESLDNRVDPQTGSIVLRAQFPNPDGRIVPGLFSRVRIPTGAKSAVLLVDESAVGTDQAQKFVLTLTSTNTAAYRPVKLGPLLEGKRVVREGLQAGEKVVVNGLAKVRPGMPVTAEERGAQTALRTAAH